MIEVKPFASLDDAREALDNGGRFYNLLTEADDCRISAAELKKAAGVFLSEQRAFLYLALAISCLRPMDRDDLLSMLTPSVAQRFESGGPKPLRSSALLREGKPGDLLLSEGTPRFVSHHARRSVVMIFTGKVMIPVPVEQHFDRYELVDPADRGEPALFIVPKGLTRVGASKDASSPESRLPECPMRLAGVLRSVLFEDPGGRVPGAFFEPLYFMRPD